MDEKEFLESQKECASMLGMTLDNYQKYLKEVKVQDDDLIDESNTEEILELLGVDKSILKIRKEW